MKLYKEYDGGGSINDLNLPKGVWALRPIIMLKDNTTGVVSEMTPSSWVNANLDYPVGQKSTDMMDFKVHGQFGNEDVYLANFLDIKNINEVFLGRKDTNDVYATGSASGNYNIDCNGVVVLNTRKELNFTISLGTATPSTSLSLLCTTAGATPYVKLEIYTIDESSVFYWNVLPSSIKIFNYKVGQHYSVSKVNGKLPFRDLCICEPSLLDEISVTYKNANGSIDDREVIGVQKLYEILPHRIYERAELIPLALNFNAISRIEPETLNNNRPLRLMELNY